LSVQFCPGRLTNCRVDYPHTATPSPSTGPAQRTTRLPHCPIPKVSTNCHTSCRIPRKEPLACRILQILDQFLNLQSWNWIVTSCHTYVSHIWFWRVSDIMTTLQAYQVVNIISLLKISVTNERTYFSASKFAQADSATHPFPREITGREWLASDRKPIEIQ
jgi:hypothetical protein